MGRNLNPRLGRILLRQNSPYSVQQKGPLKAALSSIALLVLQRVDSISNPQASNNGSGMYFEFLFRRAHSRKRVDRKY
jgi:hypothetical protein